MKRALISVSDKAGIAEFAKGLSKLGFEILSTGGTSKVLTEAGVPVKDVSEFTGFPEMMGGRVKTLHPKLHGGLLCLRDDESHMKQASENGIEMIDLVVVNLYPFERVTSNPDVELDVAIENIDIGGPSMVRSAAKNYKHVGIVVDPGDYDLVLSELEKGELTLETKSKLAVKAFSRTADYDSSIDVFLKKRILDEETIRMRFIDGTEMRYGENPHQSAMFYKEKVIDFPCISNAEQLHGKELSFNNINDTNGAIELIKEFKDETACAIIKHTNPCGVGIGSSVLDAYEKARSTDPASAFGGIIAFSKDVTKEVAEKIGEVFVEVIVAPGYDDNALDVLTQKKNVRILKLNGFDTIPSLDLKKVEGGLLVQDSDSKVISEKDLKVVTKRKPTADEMQALLFGWKVVKHVKSNAVVYVKSDRTIGVGAGQMSRVDSSEIAVIKAKKAQLDTAGTVIASDAFFPFRDGVDAAASAGVTAVIQPGGSKNDAEVIQAADEHDMAMVFTGFRAFKH